MQVFQAYQKRVGELQDLFSRLLAQELKLFETRSRSWRLQVGGSATREADLAEVGETIAGIELEVEYLREQLNDFGDPPSLADSNKPAASTAGFDPAATATAPEAAPQEAPAGG